MAVDIRNLSSDTKSISSKQASLVSGTNIKTINGSSILGSGDLVISGGGTYSADGTTACMTGTVLSVLPACVTVWNGKQSALVSGTSIKTINSTSMLGSGDISVQSTLVSGTNIKTINGTSILGSGDLVISGSSGTTDGTTLCTTSNVYSILPACNTKWNGKQDSLVSGTNIKTINGTTLLGSGDIVISGGGGSATPDGTTISTNASSQLCIVCDCKQKWDNTVPRSTYTTVDCSVGAFIDTSTLDKTVNLVFSACSNNMTTTSVYSRACISTNAMSCGGLSCSVIVQTSKSVNYAYLQSRATGGSYSAFLTLHGCCVGTGTLATLYSAHTTCVYGETLTQIGNCENGCTYIAGICLLLCGLPTTNPARMCQLWVCNGYVVSGTPGSIGSSETLGTAVASAATTSIGNVGNSVHITGTTTITSFGTGTTGKTVKVIFDGALVLTHNATSLILATGNITTAAGDSAVFLLEDGASGYWRMLSYTRKTGMALVPPTSVTTATNATNATIAKCILNTVSTCRNDGLPIVSATCNCFTNCISSPGSISALYSTCIASATGGSIIRNIATSSGAAASICNCITSTSANYPAIFCSISTSNASNGTATSYITSCSGTSGQSASSKIEAMSNIGGNNVWSSFSGNTVSTTGYATATLNTRSSSNGSSCLTISASRNSLDPGTTSTSVIKIEAVDVSDSTAAYSLRECISINTSNLKLLRIPTVDPHIVGVLWNNAGVINISAG